MRPDDGLPGGADGVASEGSALGSALEHPPDAAVVADYEAWEEVFKKPRRLLIRASDAFGSNLEDAALGDHLARTVRRHLDDGEPGSFVRLGDGEGAVLALSFGDHRNLFDYAAQQASRSHFGSASLLVEDGRALLDGLHDALAGAAVIGIPGALAVPVLLDRPPERCPLDGVASLLAVYRYLNVHRFELGLQRKASCSSSFHRSLLPHYAALISGRDIGLISCRDELPDALEREMGAREVVYHPVPVQARGTTTPHYPDRFEELVEELQSARPGRLYLVAAGMPGKVYCETIRRAGAIALDIGSIADIWAGIVTRPPNRELVEEWRIV